MPHPDEPARVERLPVDDDDRMVAAVSGDHFARMQVWAFVVAIGLAVGGWYMWGRGHTADAVACGVGVNVMLACIYGLGRARARDSRLATKDAITGVVRHRIRVQTEYNTFHALDVGGIEVSVPAAVHDRFREGQVVRVERLSGSRRFLSIRPVAVPDLPP